MTCGLPGAQRVNSFEAPKDGFALPTDSMLLYETLPTHPKDPKKNQSGYCLWIQRNGLI